MARPSKRASKARRVAAAAKQASQSFDNPQLAEMYAWAMEQHAEGNDDPLRFLQQLESIPVPIEEFLESPEFMGATDLSLWPEVRKVIVDSCKYWWKGLGNGAIKEILLTGATGCVDGATEFLSRQGWKRIDEYEEGDEVLQYWGTGKAEWVVPEEYHVKPSGGFYYFLNKTVDQMLTPGHRMIFRATKSGNVVEYSAEEVAARHERTRNGFSGGKFISAYQFDGGSGLDMNDQEIQLMVAATHLGRHVADNTQAVECRIRSDRKKDELLKLLKECKRPFTYVEASNGVHVVVYTAPRLIDNYRSWYDASREQLQLIAKEMVKWSDVKERNRIYTSSGDIADFTQHVFTGFGNRCSVTKMHRHQNPNGCDEYCVHVCTSDSSGLLSTNKAGIPIIPTVSGKCYCFTVPTGMWVMRRGGKIVVTGNTGKSEIAKVVTAYHLHIIGCMKSVQAFYGLPSATGVVFPIQAAKPHVTKKVVYAPLRSYVEHMPWFRRNMKPSKLVESEMYFEKQNVRVVPGGAESDAILGEAIIGGIVDEINFMNVVQNSKKAEIEGGRSGTYDQAQTVYDALTKRRKGRFITRGPHIGIMCISSSRRYRGDFTDRRQAYVEESGEEGVIIYDKAQYEARPAHLFSGEKFRVALMNDAMGDIRILEEEDADPRGAVVFDVPIEYIEEFKKDPAGSMRDIIGRSTHAISPFFRKRTVIEDFFQRGRMQGLESILHKDNVVLGIEGMPRVKRDMYCMNPSKPRYVHIDLSHTGDRCGIAMLRYDGMVQKSRGSGVDEMLPSATVELACTIEPDHISEIDLAEVRTWVKQLKDVYGYPIKSVSYDGWNSLESRQQWKKAGMKTGLISVDKSSTPYKQMREAMMDERLSCYPQTVLNEELLELEYDDKKDKVDHPPSGYKDCADAVCGAYHNLLSRSSTWVGGFSREEDPRYAGRVDTGDRFYDERPE